MQLEKEMITPHQTILLRPKPRLENVGQLKQELEILQREGYQQVLIDLLHLDWVDSKEIGALLMSVKMLMKAHIRLGLLVEAPLLLTTLQTTGIDQLIPIYPSKEKALAALGQG